MKIKWARHIATTVLSTSLLVATAPIYVNADETPSLSASADYRLTNTIQAEVKSILNEPTPGGTRLGAVVRLYNQGSKIAAIPEDEVRLRTKDGVEYTLRPSTTNATAILPKEKVELSYLVVVDREDPFALTDISWVDVDPYVYPKTEKLDLTIPIASMEWHGDSSEITNPSSIKAWDQTFTIPGLSGSLRFKPINVLKQMTPNGPAAVVTLLAENIGVVKQEIPDFRIDGKSSRKVYNGTRVEKDAIVLEPGEKQYIHYSIQLQNDDDALGSLNILTPETFTGDNQTNVSYTIGRLNVRLPDAAAALPLDSAEAYKIDAPIRFDPLNKLIPSDVEVSLKGLQIYGGGSGGYNVATAKFRMKDKSDQPKPIPNFQAELSGTEGNSYTGVRQNLTIKNLVPNLDYFVYYTFVLPGSEKGDRLTMKILDSDSAAPYSLPIAAFRTQAQEATSSSGSEMAFDPFHVKLDDWKVSSTFGQSGYLYKIMLDTVVSQDAAVVDQNYARMKVEVSNKDGKLLGSQSFAFSGDNKISTGIQTVAVTSGQLETALTVKIYEAVDSPFGEAKRLVQTLQY